MGILSRWRSKSPDSNLSFTSPKTLHDVLLERLKNGNRNDRFWFEYSRKGLCGVTLISSLYLNTIMRRSLLVYEGFLVSTLSSTLFAFPSNYLSQQFFMERSFLTGNLRCGTCAITRGAVIQSFTGCVVPGVVALCATVILAERFQSKAMPNVALAPMKEISKFFKKNLPPALKGAKYVFALHAFLGAACAMKQHEISERLIKTLQPDDMNILLDTLYKDLDRYL